MPRLDQEHELGAVLAAEDHWWRVLGLRRNVGDLRRDRPLTAVASHADRLSDFHRTENSLLNEKTDFDTRRRQKCHHRRAGRHPFTLHVERVGDLTVARRTRGFLLESPVGLREGLPRGGGCRLRRADLVGTRGELCSGELGLQLAHSRAVALARRTRRVCGFVGDKFRAYQLLLPRQIAFGKGETRLGLCKLGPDGVDFLRALAREQVAVLRIAWRRCSSAWRRAAASFSCSSANNGSPVFTVAPRAT